MNIPRTFKGFLAHIERHGDVTAVYDHKGGWGLSYTNLVSRSYALASKLAIREGERVVLYDLSHIEWVLVFFAIQLRGGIAVPIDERTSDSFIQSAIELTGPSLVITNSKNARFAGLTTLSFRAVEDNPVSPLSNIQESPDRPCEIIFTSGTWSNPKGVTLSSRNLLANAEQILAVYPYKNIGAVLGILPLSHAYQQTLGLLVPLTIGSKIVFLKVSNSLDLTEAIRTHHIVVMPLVPRVLELMYGAITRTIRNRHLRKLFVQCVQELRHLPLPLRRLLLSPIRNKIGPSLKVLVSGGSPLHQELDQFFHGLGYEVFLGYGLTECSPIVTASFASKRQEGEIGAALPGVSVTLTPESEMLVRGENVFLGYWPHHTGESEVNTGDKATLSESGTFILRGRTKNLIIFNTGEKCFCEDFERIIDSYEDVEASCVVERTVNGITQAECMVATAQNKRIETTELMRYVHAHMPRGIRLSKITVVTSQDFPRTHTLKPNRARILALLNT